MVGIAFSIGFIIGPMIGAMFSVWARQRTDEWFVIPALFALFLTLLNIIYFTTTFNETLQKVCTIPLQQFFNNLLIIFRKNEVKTSMTE